MDLGETPMSYGRFADQVVRETNNNSAGDAAHRKDLNRT